MLVNVILCGGVGSRLWPLSRSTHPKPFAKLFSDQSLLQQTVLRNAAVVDLTLVVCGESHKFLVAEQLVEIGVKNYVILTEAAPRDTAPAISLAAKYLQQEFPNQNPVLIVTPADHLIRGDQAYQASLLKAVAACAEQKLVCLGATVKSPHVGYGYIKVNAAANNGVYCVEQFVEKPSLERAQDYFAAGTYYWNIGIFVFTLQDLVRGLTQHANDVFENCDKVTCRKISIDYALMEKANNIAMVALSAEWFDIGDWQALYDQYEKCPENNVALGDVVTTNTRNSLLYSSSRLVATVGLEDIAVIETRDAVLVSKLGDAANLKKLIQNLEATSRSEYATPSRVSRPWGTYETLELTPHFQVKHIVVKPGAKLSLQMHHYRSEHWVVISGVATVTCGEREYDLQKNESTFIPVETKHRLENKTKQPLEIIEVQCGSYLGEDDIVRFDDVYGRVEAPV